MTPSPRGSQVDASNQECLEWQTTLILSLCRRAASAMMSTVLHVTGLRKPSSCCLLPSPTPKMCKDPVLYTQGGHFLYSITPPRGSSPGPSPAREHSIRPSPLTNETLSELKVSFSLKISSEHQGNSRKKLASASPDSTLATPLSQPFSLQIRKVLMPF